MAETAERSPLQRVEDFRAERLKLLTEGKNPYSLADNPAKVVVHLVPANPEPFNVNDIEDKSWGAMEGGYSTKSFSFDGIIRRYMTPTAEDRSKTVCASYALFFRSGTLEAVDLGSFLEAPGIKNLSPSLQSGIARLLNQFSSIHATVKESYLALSMLNVEGYRFPTEPYRRTSLAIDRNDLLFPVQLISTTQDYKEALKTLRPLFDHLWQATGAQRCPFFDSKGE